MTVRVLPSPGLAKLVLMMPAAMSAALSTKVLMSVPLVTRRVSPVLASAARVTRTSIAPTSSAMLMRPSLLLSSVMAMVEANGAMVSSVTVTVLAAPWLPATSVALTLRVLRPSLR